MLPQPCGIAVWRLAAKVFSGGLAFMLPLAAQSDPAKMTGNAAAGKVIFEGKGGCVACHSIGDRGASLGPDLGAIGITRSAKSLRLALVDPNAEISKSRWARRPYDPSQDATSRDWNDEVVYFCFVYTAILLTCPPSRSIPL